MNFLEVQNRCVVVHLSFGYLANTILNLQVLRVTHATKQEVGSNELAFVITLLFSSQVLLTEI